jgi:hypothetical protein
MYIYIKNAKKRCLQIVVQVLEEAQQLAGVFPLAGHNVE